MATFTVLFGCLAFFVVIGIVLAIFSSIFGWRRRRWGYPGYYYDRPRPFFPWLFMGGWFPRRGYYGRPDRFGPGRFGSGPGPGGFGRGPGPGGFGRGPDRAGGAFGSRGPDRAGRTFGGGGGHPGGHGGFGGGGMGGGGGHGG